MYFEQGANNKLKDTDRVKVTKYRDETIEVKNVQHRNNSLTNIVKISKREYYNKKTGKICQYKIEDKKNISTLRNNMKKLKQILKNNFFGEKNEIFVTLTTQRVVSSINEMKKAFNSFFRKLKRKYNGLEYVYVLELQEKRNSWHIHTLIKDLKNKQLFIDIKEIEQMWNKGNCCVKRVGKQSNEICKNYNDINKNEIREKSIEGIIDYMTKTKTKEHIPVGVKPWGKSKGIIKPEVIKQTYSEFKENNLDCEKVQETTLLLRNTEKGAILNRIKTEKWKRTKSKGEINNGEEIHNIKRKYRIIRNKCKNNEKKFRKG